MSASAQSETLECPIPGKQQILKFVLTPHPEGLYCTRIVAQGLHEPIRMSVVVRDRGQWHAMLAADEFARRCEAFLARVAAAGERLLP